MKDSLIAMPQILEFIYWIVLFDFFLSFQNDYTSNIKHNSIGKGYRMVNLPIWTLKDFNIYIAIFCMEIEKNCNFTN